MSGNKPPLAHMVLWYVLGPLRHAPERQLMCKVLTVYERSHECMKLWLHPPNPTRLISAEPQWCHLIQPTYQYVIPTRSISLPVLQEGMGFWHSGVQHLLCLMLKNLTVAVYETVILKFFKAPGLLLICYGTTNIRFFYPLVSSVTSGCWMSDEGRDTVAVRLQGLFAQHGESCLLQGMWTVLLNVSLC
jgi:hypothetical protein